MTTSAAPSREPANQKARQFPSFRGITLAACTDGLVVSGNHSVNPCNVGGLTMGFVLEEVGVLEGVSSVVDCSTGT